MTDSTWEEELPNPDDPPPEEYEYDGNLWMTKEMLATREEFWGLTGLGLTLIPGHYGYRTMDFDVVMYHHWRSSSGDHRGFDELPLDLEIEASIDLVSGIEGPYKVVHKFGDPYSVMRLLRWLLLDPLEREFPYKDV